MEEKPEAHPGDRKVLVVEDDPAHQTLILEYLRRAGIDYLSPVTTGTEAVELAIKVNPAVMVLDIDLEGGMTGIEVAKEVAEMRTVLVVFLSGHDEERIVDEAHATFPFTYLTKPADPSQLTALIHGAFRYRECLRKGLPKAGEPTEMITICSWCRAVRNERHGWMPLVDYVIDGPIRRFTHGACDACTDRILKEEDVE